MSIIKKHTLLNLFQEPSFLYFLLLIVAFLSRCLILGNPFIYVDEEFYLYVGGRMLHGDLPYVDIWDRKPIGIFLLYEFFHLFGPYRIWVYQIAALLSAWLTSIFCLKTARYIAPLSGAFCAGCLYLLWIVGYKGAGGQTPVFYNLLVTAAVFLVVRYLSNKPPGKINSVSLLVMILFGISIQIKPTVIFEGAYIGLFLLWTMYKEQKSWGSIISHAILWCAVALLPTLAVAAFYASNHHFYDWWFANVSSIFLKDSTFNSSLSSFWQEGSNAITVCALFLAVLGCRLLLTRKINSTTASYFLAGWAVSAVAGYLLFGCFSKHYALPLFAPLFINTAPLWEGCIALIFLISNTETTHSTVRLSAQAGRLALLAFFIGGLIEVKHAVKGIHQQGTLHDFKVISKLLSSDPGCVFILRAPDILSDITPYCSLTRLPFSDHLGTITERNALPVEPVAEIKHILSQKPLYIIINDDSYDPNINPETEKLVHDELQESYHVIYTHHQIRGIDNIIIYKRTER